MRNLLASLVVLLALLAPAARAQVGISPSIQEIRLDQPAQVMTFKLTNFEDKPKQVIVTVSNWTLDAAGEVQVLPSEETSLDRWVIVSPLQFTIEPHSTQTIRVAVRPPMELAPGEHRAMVYFHEVLAPREEGVTGIRGRFRIGAAIYAYQGEPQRVGTISTLNASAAGFEGQMTSSGNAHARLGGFYAVWRADAFPGLAASPLAALASAPNAEVLPEGVAEASDLPTLPVLPGSTRPLKIDFGKLPPGRYMLEFRGGMSGVAAPQAVPFTVAATAPGS